MKKSFTLEYWQDDKWFVGKLKEIPGVFSQGETLNELFENIQDAYNMMVESSDLSIDHPDSKIIELGIEI
ncbi:MAG: type II toxin-antitoxin system HicB family antitoxin [Fidelibacterota bacterium]